MAPQQQVLGGGGAGGGGQGGHVNGGIEGTATIAFTIPPAGAGQWWLNPIGTFSASNNEPTGGSSFEVRAKVTVSGSDANGQFSELLAFGPSKTILAPQASANNWVLNASFIQTTQVANSNFVANADLTAVELPLTSGIETKLFLDDKSVTKSTP